MVKMHLMTGELTHSGAAKTFCGKVGWEEQGWSNEYTDAENRRFDGTDVAKKVTCKRCLAALERT